MGLIPIEGNGYTMPIKGSVTGQRISHELQARARELRKNLTTAEALLWQHIRAGRLQSYHFWFQQVIGRFVVDFYCCISALVV